MREPTLDYNLGALPVTDLHNVMKFLRKSRKVDEVIKDEKRRTSIKNMSYNNLKRYEATK